MPKASKKQRGGYKKTVERPSAQAKSLPYLHTDEDAEKNRVLIRAGFTRYSSPRDDD